MGFINNVIIQHPFPPKNTQQQQAYNYYQHQAYYKQCEQQHQQYYSDLYRALGGNPYAPVVRTKKDLRIEKLRCVIAAAGYAKSEVETATKLLRKYAND